MRAGVQAAGSEIVDNVRIRDAPVEQPVAGSIAAVPAARAPPKLESRELEDVLRYIVYVVRWKA